MNKDFVQYVYTRCENALTENEGYMELQSKCVVARKNNDIDLYDNLSCEAEATAEELCYLKGFNDAIQMMLSTK